jgi:hypothetical protein
MPAISQRIPNLLGGISQQPDALKLPGQLRLAKNCVPDPTYGMLKRPGLKYVSALVGASNEGRWFSIFRDETERYVGQFKTDGTLLIWDAVTGAAKTVNSISTSAKSYIANCSASDFEMLQINDYNFILNRSKTVGTLGVLSSAQAPVGIVTVSLIGYDATYKVTVDGLSFTYTTPTTGTLNVATVVSSLAVGIAGLGGGSIYTTLIAGNTIIVRRTNNADFIISGDGGTSSQALLVYKDTVPSVSRLPTTCQNGLILRVSSLEDDNSDDYYVKFVVTQGGTSIGAGIWEECLAPGVKPYIDPDTMPHVIIRETNGSFTFRSLNEVQKAGDDLYWVERRVGDDETNPFPSFSGKRITGISFFRNRLVLLSGSNVICSQPGSYFNLFRLSALAQTDADAVDLSTGSLKPVDLRHALGDQMGLVIFSSTTQFMLTSDTDQFGPVSAQVKQFCSFNINTKSRPVETGISFVFVDDNQGYSQVTEMVATSADNRPSIADLSRTAPNFVPASLSSMVASQSASLISFQGTADLNTLRIFKFFNNSGERVLASWMQWELPSNCLHQSIDADVLYLVTQQSDGIGLSTISLLNDVDGTAINQSGISYEYRLDLFVKAPTMSYVAGTDKTKVYLKPGSYLSGRKPVVVVDDTATQRGTVYTDLVIQNDGSYYVEIPGNRTAALQVVVGYPYDYRLDFPVFYRKQSFSDGRAQADVTNIPRVHRLVIQSNDSGPYNAEVKLLGRTPKTFVYPQRIANQYLADTAPVPAIVDNTIPIYGKGTDASVSIFSDTPFPISFVAATWYGVYSNRGIMSV